MIFTAIRIGFQFSSYTYYEPEFDTLITNITLIKEDNVETEQILSMILTYTEGTADINEDYTVNDYNTQIRNIPPNLQNVSLWFQLHPDDISEGTESFKISAAGNQGFPFFETPIKTFPSTTIFIIDNDRKCLLLLVMNYIAVLELSVQIISRTVLNTLTWSLSLEPHISCPKLCAL